MNPFPETVTILGQEVKLVIAPDDPEAEELGSFDSNTMTITVLDRPGIERFLCHEIAHAILEFSGITNLIEKDIEETIATVFEYGFSALYKRNF